MRDRLHLFPTFGDLVWVWAAGALVRLVWWAVTSERSREQAQLNARKKSDDSSGASCVALSAASTTIKDDVRIGDQPAPGDTRPHRPLLWRTLCKQSFVLAVAIVAVQALSSTVLLYARTGAWLEQPYDWYSLRTTGERRFAKTTPLPSQILSTCRYRNASAALEEMLTVEDVVEEHTSQQRESKVGATRTIVYVVPYGTDGVIELSAKHVEPVRDRNASSSLRVLSGSARDRTVDYERAAPVDELTLFPTLWHSILGPHFSDQVEAPSAWSRIVEPLGLEYRIVRSQRELSALPSSSNVFAVVQWMPNILRLLESGELPADARVGYLALSREDCSNANVRQYIDAKQLKFGLLPYGDCSLVDGERFAVVPLGPSFEHGFPTNSHKTPIPPIDKRKFLLSLMVSWTVEKPTRIQAMMAALRACDEGHACIVEHSALAFKALQKVDELMGLNLRWFLSSAPNTYVENLKQSVFTLCPHGKNPEQYRIWEALAAGSIPVVEEFPRQSLPGTFYHPSYPTSWKCVPEDIHGVLKRLKAPVLFVRDWRRDLPRIVDKYVNNEDGPKRLLELQRRARQWYADLGQHLQADMLRKSLHHFAASP